MVTKVRMTIFLAPPIRHLSVIESFQDELLHYHLNGVKDSKAMKQMNNVKKIAYIDTKYSGMHFCFKRDINSTSNT